MSDEVPYWRPPRLFDLSLTMVVGTIKKWFDDSEKLKNSELALPTSICNHLVERFMSTSTWKHSKILLSAIVDSPWCRFTKLCIKYSRDRLDYRPQMKLLQYPLTELAIECDASDFKNINLNEIGPPLGNTLVSLTLKHCNVEYEGLQYAFRCLVRLVHLTVHCISFYGERREFQTTVPLLPSLEVLDLSFTDLSTVETILSAQKNVKVLQLYNASIHVPVEMFCIFTNLVVLDISTKVQSTSMPVLNESALMASLSKMHSLKSLDVSCREISDVDVQLFDQPHHRMAFLGLFNITICNHQAINADQVW